MTTADGHGRSGGPAVVLVVDPGGSGAGTLVGALRRLGVAVPAPEVAGDPTARRGSGEPRWVVELHQRLLRRARTMVRDARPQAWAATAEVTTGPRLRDELRTWLAGLLEESHDVVVHEPRLGWFLPLWRDVLAELGAEATYVTMVRHPAAVVREHTTYDDSAGSQQHALAAWVNRMTRVEQLTRGASRVFVSHDQLLADWRGPLAHLTDVGLATEPTRAQQQEIDDLVGPGVLSAPTTWGDAPVSPPLRTLAATAWDQLDRMTDPARDEEAIHHRIDALRAAYEAYYAAEEALARSALDAAWRRGAQARRRTLAETGG